MTNTSIVNSCPHCQRGVMERFEDQWGVELRCVVCGMEFALDPALGHSPVAAAAHSS